MAAAIPRPTECSTPAYRRFWLLLVKVIGDSMGDHRRLHGRAVGYLHRVSELDPVAIGRVPPPGLRMIRR